MDIDCKEKEIHITLNLRGLQAQNTEKGAFGIAGMLVGKTVPEMS